MGRRELDFGLMQKPITTLRQSRTFSRIYHYQRLRRMSALRNEPIIIYQMGKVGSTAVMRSLKAQAPDVPAYHVHYLSEDGIADAHSRLAAQNRRGDRNVNRWCLYESAYLRNEIPEIKRRHGRLRIVSLVRDPVGRNLSSLFYNLDDFLEQWHSWGDRVDAGVLSRLGEVFLETFPEHEFPLRWFDDEFRPFTGIDVFNEQFDKERGYAIYRREGLEVLILKLERASQVLEEAIREFIGIGGVGLVKANTAEDLAYADLYSQFLKSHQIPEEYIRQLYESKFARQFYTPLELKQFEERWRPANTTD